MLGSSPSVSIVVPARNEARNLETVLPSLPAVHEVILVDGGSVDGTVEAARRVLPGITVVHQTRRGKGNALACGFEQATGDIIIMFDADGSADPAEIPAFVSALVNGADFAKGSRFRTRGSAQGSSEDITVIRKLGNAGLNTLANLLFRTAFSDLCYGYNAFWRRILPVLDLPPTDIPGAADMMHWGDGFEIESVISCRVAAAGLRVTEVPSVERRRIYGDTNLRTFADGSRVLRTIIAERWTARTRAPRSTTPQPVLEPIGMDNAVDVAAASVVNGATDPVHADGAHGVPAIPVRPQVARTRSRLDAAAVDGTVLRAEGLLP